jgi:hypothetical protein
MWVLMEAAVSGPFSAFSTRCFLEVYGKVNPFQQTNKNQQNQKDSPHIPHSLPVANINQSANANWLITPLEGSPFQTHLHIAKSYHN